MQRFGSWEATLTMADRIVTPEVVVQRRIRARVRQLSARFRQLHQRGVKALKSRDYGELSDVIARERALIGQHQTLIERSRKIIQRRAARPRVTKGNRVL
jgi:hypothetical protein